MEGIGGMGKRMKSLRQDQCLQDRRGGCSSVRLRWNGSVYVDKGQICGIFRETCCICQEKED